MDVAKLDLQLQSLNPVASMGIGPTVDQLLTTSIRFTCSSNLSSKSLI